MNPMSPAPDMPMTPAPVEPDMPGEPEIGAPAMEPEIPGEAAPEEEPAA